MIQFFDLRLPIAEEKNLPLSEVLAAEQLKISNNRIKQCRLIRRSIDARSKVIKVNLRYQVFIDEEPKKEQAAFQFQSVKNAPAVHIVGCGPAALFAALQLIDRGLKPVIYERGKDVRSRRRDIAELNKNQLLNPESNYCFGEGGAGTYSDGKLHTRSKKRGDVSKVLSALVDFGAKEDILYQAHPHIGTNKLPQIIVAIRDFILQSGGEIHFQHRLTDFNIQDQRVVSIELNQKLTVPLESLVLATGHSARDIFYLLRQKGLSMEAKPFAMGVRVEHPQSTINQIQYHGNELDDLLPPATYQLVRQIDQRGVYSFCMCPGGIIAPCATSKGEIVTNGWSPSRRNNPFANSGIVVSVEQEDWADYASEGPLAAMKFQMQVEQSAFQAANQKAVEGKSGQLAPAQGLLDFVYGRPSKDLPKCSYQPGVVPCRLDLLLPTFIAQRLQKAFLLFGKSMRGYLSNDAVVVGVESRTSSPVKIPRDRKKMHHLEIENLYPVGEGAGYAGGIVSAAIDGMKAAAAIADERKLEIEPR